MPRNVAVPCTDALRRIDFEHERDVLDVDDAIGRVSGTGPGKGELAGHSCRDSIRGGARDLRPTAAYCGSMTKSSWATEFAGGVAPSCVSAASSSATCAAVSSRTCSAG